MLIERDCFMTDKNHTTYRARRRVALTVYIATITFMMAHSLNALVAHSLVAPTAVSMDLHRDEPMASQSDAQYLAQQILTSGLFPVPAAPLSDGSNGQSAPSPPMDVAKRVALIGTVMGKEGGAMAVLEEVPSKQQRLYRRNDQVPNVGTLAVIEKDRVLFREGTKEEWLDLLIAKASKNVPPLAASSSEATQALKREPSPAKRILDRRYIAELTEDLPRILTHAQAAPNLTAGKIDGYRMLSVAPLGFFDKIGLQTNDVLQRINGVEIRDPAAMLSFLQQLKNERSVRFDLIRNQQPQTLTYEIR